MKKVFFLYALILVIPYSALSQSTNISTAFHGSIKKADTYFNHFAYRNALHLYQHALDRNPGDLYVRERIAACYFKLHDPESAEKWFSQLVNEPNVNPESLFEYAEALSMNGKYDESKIWFENYLKLRPDSKMAQEKLAFLKDLKFYLSDSLRFVMNTVTFNSTHSEYGAHYFHKGVVFASSRDADVLVKHKAFDAVDEDESLLNMYYVTGKKHGEHEEVQPLHKEHIKSYFHEGPMAFYKQDTKTAFTRTGMKNGKPVYDKNKRAHLQIYFADVDALGSMSNIVAFEHNNDGYSTAHPTVSPDGATMYFSSASPQGFGGSDIYYSTFANGKWSLPENAGPNINTPGDESFPFLGNDSTLYFSSNGHGTLGGLDILMSHKRNGKWAKALNFGGLLNSRYDDFSLVADSTGRVGYIASNRPGGIGLDDIYYFVATNYFLTGKVVAYDKTGAPVEGVSVYAVDPNTGKVIDASVTDADGRYELSLPFDQSVKIVAYKDGYDMIKDQLVSTLHKPMGGDSLNMSIWKRDMFARGNLYSNETQQPLTGVTVTITDLATNKTDSVVLADQSQYRLLVKPNGKYKLEFKKPGYIKEELNLNTDGLFHGEILNDIVLHEEFINNAVINFEYDKFDLNEEAMALMAPLVRTLKQYPKATLNIGAHADSRGSVPYNQRLSDNRARSTVEYFVSRGIARKRITAKGFGEGLLLNRCTDTETCEEVEHSKNRRAEIKVQIKK